MKTEEKQLDNVAGGVDRKLWNNGPDPSSAV